jgi:hypothetical protein
MNQVDNATYGIVNAELIAGKNNAEAIESIQPPDEYCPLNQIRDQIIIEMFRSQTTHLYDSIAIHH